MTNEEFRTMNIEWCNSQIEWYGKQVDWETKDIEYLTDQLIKERQSDKELVEYVWEKGPLTKYEMEIYGVEKFESIKTHEIKLQRRRSYLRRKKYNQRLEQYKKELAEWQEGRI